MMHPADYDALSRKAVDMTITPDELDAMNAESQRRSYVLTAYVDKELALRPLGNCGGCGYGEVAVNPIPASMSVMVFCGHCNAARKMWSNIGEPESWQ